MCTTIIFLYHNSEIKFPKITLCSDFDKSNVYARFRFNNYEIHMYDTPGMEITYRELY